MIEDGVYQVPAGKQAVITTHLEMFAQSPLKGVALPDGVTFRKVTPDIAWYRDTFDRVGTPWLWFGRLLLSEAAVMDILNDSLVETYTLEKDGRAEALLELDFRVDDACELAYFGVADALIGTGAARYLMDRAVERAWSKPITRFHVHTCTADSQRAPDFYVRSGFVPFKREVEICDDPRVTGLLPRTVAPHMPLIDEA
jgi:N-acetylglutamate synthase-like GNAT family acetyltransferase